ncbi:unnamed protein product, partial [Prorocentrum cordatum]
MIKAAIVVNDLPCAAEQDPAWKAWKASPAQVVFALKVQTKCAQAAPPARSAPEACAGSSDVAGMAEAVKQLAELQTQVLQKGKPKGLTFKLQDRIVEVGLQNFDGDEDTLPSEEILAKFEAGAKIANDKGRAWIGSAEGEDLRDHHRPAWSRTPLVDAVVGDGSYEDRVRQSAAAKGESAWIDKIDYAILAKACSMADFFFYARIMVRIAEENGGVRTAFQCDVLQRRAMAKALERGETDLRRYLTRIDVDLLRTAKDKLDKRFAELARAS